MYKVSQEVIQLFNSGKKQTVDIQVKPISGESFTLSSSDITNGGFSVDRYSATGDKIEIGSVVSAECDITLENKDGRFDNVVFEGAELVIKIGIKDWDDSTADMHYVPLGVFIVDAPPRALNTISITSLDRMAHFDRTVSDADLAELFYNAPTIAELLVRLCNKCAVSLSTTPSTLLNSDYIVTEKPTDENLTYRQILKWICEITGTCGYMDWDGKLRLEWYNNQSDITITPSIRYSSDVAENDITLSGIEVDVTDNEVYQTSPFTDDYAIAISDNSLISNGEPVASGLSQRVGLTYRPFSAKIKSAPYLYPMDVVAFQTKVPDGDTIDTESDAVLTTEDGVKLTTEDYSESKSVTTILTNVNYTLNSATDISAKGETQARGGYAAQGSLTSQQKLIIKKQQKQIDKTAYDLSTQEKATDYLNNAAAMSLGLFHTEVTDDTGAITYYWHDAKTLEESQYICMRNAAGSFTTYSGWNNGSPVWDSGTDKYGNALFSLLDTIGIQAEWIRAESITTDKMSIGQPERGTNLVLDSSFEANALYYDATFNESGEAVDYEHNAYWNFAKCGLGDNYDPAPFAGVDGHSGEAPREGAGFDNGKAHIDTFLGKKSELSAVSDSAFGYSTRSPFPINVTTHCLSFYYRIKTHKTGTISSSATATGQILVKLQWLNEQKQVLSTSLYPVTYTDSNNTLWQRVHTTITPPNSTAYCNLLIAAHCGSITSTDDSSAYFDLDGILLEEGLTLNNWTCAPSEVSRNGVLIDSKGLNVSDGKIKLTDSGKRDVLYTDGNQILQHNGGVTIEKYNPTPDEETGKKDVALRMSLNPIQFSDSGQRGSVLGATFESFDENGSVTNLGYIGINSPTDNSSGSYNAHPDADKYRPITFEAPNGFVFGDGKTKGNPIMTAPTILTYGENSDELTVPGYYHIENNVIAGSISNLPSLNDGTKYNTAGIIRVEEIGHTKWLVQTYFPQITNTGRVFMRSASYDGKVYTWGIWHQFCAGEDEAPIINAKQITADGGYISDNLIVGGTCTAAAWQTTSDRDKKKDIRSIDEISAVAKINQLHFYTYSMKDNDTHIPLGIMADEAPNEILGADRKSINLYSYISLCAKAVQELSDEVANLKREIEKLKGDDKNG